MRDLPPWSAAYEQPRTSWQSRNLIVRYGLAVDLGDADGVAELFTPDAEFEVGNASADLKGEDKVFRGREQIRNDLVLGPHQSLLPNCAHTIGPVVVHVLIRLAHRRARRD